jgi:hypothetical protein
MSGCDNARFFERIYTRILMLDCQSGRQGFKGLITFEWIIGLLLGAVLLSALARRIKVPYPTFLAIGGMLLAFVPSGPSWTLEPELALALALFVAPVLLSRWRGFHRRTPGGSAAAARHRRRAAIDPGATPIRRYRRRCFSSA